MASQPPNSRGEDVTPRPYEVIESIRDFGYTPSTAIADLVDNCITAGASQITINIASDSSGHAHISVVDNGRGMSLPTFVEAMRLGSGAPPSERHASDLGRFGFGLKTASLSQGRCLTVITKRRDDYVPFIRRLDMDHIRLQGWTLATDPSPAAAQYVETVSRQESGTAVVITELDRTSFFHVPARNLSEHLGNALKAVSVHLGMVFHRFIEAGLNIQVGPSRLAPWDPFLKGKSTALPSESVHFRNQDIHVSPFVLPHHSKLSDLDHDAAGGPHGWNAHQGYYIYRSNRLIVPGTWLNLNLRKEDHYKLARIAVDLPNSMDAEWHLNVMKAHVAAPAALRDEFRRIASYTRKQAGEVYRFRGERAAPTNAPAQRFVWVREAVSRGARFRIDRSHPAVQSLLHSGCEHEEVLKSLISMVESTVPVAAMLQDPPRALDGAVSVDSEEMLSAYVELARHAELFFLRAGKPPAEARKAVLNAEPFAQWRDAIAERLDNSSSAQ